MDEKKIIEIARIVCDNYSQNGLCFIDGDICDNVVCKYYKGAKALLEQGYRKESDTAKHILTVLRRQYPPRNDKKCTLADCYMIDIIEDLACKYGVDLGE